MKRPILIAIAVALVGAAGAVFLLTGSHTSTPEDRYREIGTIAAVAERCLHAPRLHEATTAFLDSAARDTMFGGIVIVENTWKPILQSYTAGYQAASVDLRLWDPARGRAEPTPQNCSDAAQMQRVRTLEEKAVAEIAEEAAIFKHFEK